MNLSERIACDIMQHCARLTDSEKSFAPIRDSERYWILRGQIEKIIDKRLFESIKEERYS